MNRKNIQTLINHLKKVPDATFDMDNFLVSSRIGSGSKGKTLGHRTAIFSLGPNDFEQVKEVVSIQTASKGKFQCDTMGCIAGHAALLSVALSASPDEVHQCGDYCIEGRGQKWLGLNDHQAECLFHAYTNHGYSIDFSKIEKYHAIKVLENALKTGRISWSITGLRAGR